MVYVGPVFCNACPTGRNRIDPGASDLHEYLGGARIMPTTPHPITKEQVPLTLGHEFSGTIEEVGEDVHDIKVGARVTVQPIIYDGTCGACKEGYINCCDGNGFVGLSGESLVHASRCIPDQFRRVGRWALRARRDPSKCRVRGSRECLIRGRW